MRADDGKMGSNCIQLLEALRLMPQAAHKLEDEIQSAVTYRIVDNAKARDWTSTISSYVRDVGELLDHLEKPAEHGADKLVEWLTRARHELRDFQQGFLDEAMAVFMG